MILAARTGPRLFLSFVALLCLTGTLLAPIGSAFVRPVSAGQPLCLGETIWDEGQQQCVPIAEETASTEPVAASPSPLPSPSSVETNSTGPEASSPASEMPSVNSPSGPPMDDRLVGYDPTLSAFYAIVNACQDDRDWYAVADADPFHDPFVGPFCPLVPSSQLPFIISVNGERVATPSATPVNLPPSYAYANNLPPGDYTIQAASPDGYGTPIVYCRLVEKSNQNNIIRASQRYFASVDGAIEIPAVLDGEGIQCGWNNVPTNASAGIQIRGFQCPSAFDPSGIEPDVLRTTCPFVQDQREFMILGPDGVDHQYADPAGNVIYERLLPGSYQITGFQPDDAQPPFVFCELLGPDGQTLRQYDYQFPAGSDAIDYDLNTLETLRCDWFFIPGDVALAVDFPTEICAATTPTPEPSRIGLGITIGREIACQREETPRD